MRTTPIAVAALGLALSFFAQHGQAQTPEASRVGILCLKSGEQISGQNKICYYNCAGSEAAITIKSYELCPMSINR